MTRDSRLTTRDYSSTSLPSTTACGISLTIISARSRPIILAASATARERTGGLLSLEWASEEFGLRNAEFGLQNRKTELVEVIEFITAVDSKQ